MNNTKIYIWWGWCDDVYIFKSIFFKKKIFFLSIYRRKKDASEPHVCGNNFIYINSA